MSNRGSVTVITAIVISTLMVMLSASQNMMAILAGRDIDKNLNVKSGKRINGGGITLTSTLLYARKISYVANLDGTISWQGNINSPSFTYNNVGPTGLPQIKMPNCNPRAYQQAPGLFVDYSTKTPPIAGTCANANTDVTPAIDFKELSNNGVWRREGPNFLSVSSGAAVPIVRAAAGPSLPVRDDARLELRAPTPTCSLSAVNNDPAFPKQIIIGQTITLVVSTSKNAEKASVQNTEGGPYIDLPTKGIPADLNRDQGGAIVTVKTTHPGPTTYRAFATGPKDPLDGAVGTGDCSVEIMVYPVPSCTLGISPGEVTVGQPATLSMTTSNIAAAYSPIKSASIDGTPTGKSSGTKVVYPPQGHITYYGAVTGINNYPTQTCHTDVYSYAYPVCSMAPAAPLVDSGTWDAIYMYTNLSASRNTSGNALIAATIDGTAVNPKANPTILGVLMQNPYTVPIVRNVPGTVTGVNNSVNSCSTAVVVKPVCPYRNPAYVGIIGIPGYGNHLFSRTWNPRNVGACNWLCEDGGCRAAHGIFGEIVYENAAKQFGDFTGRAASAGCFGSTAVCGSYYVIAPCSTPAASWIIRDLNDPTCQPTVWMVRNDGDGCFARDAKITLADGSLKNVQDITDGDKLWNPVLKTGMAVHEKTRGPEKIPMYVVGYGENRVRVTETHPFPTRQGMKQARELTMRDEIQSGDGKWHRVAKIERPQLRDDELVYNFALETKSADEASHMIVVDGIVTGDLFVQRRLATSKGTHP